MPSTRSSVLGKRSHQPEPSSSSSTALATPESTPKRVKTSTVAELNGDHNKENVPPFSYSPETQPASARATRAARRSTTAAELPSPTAKRAATKRRASVSESMCPATPTAAIATLTLSTPPPTPPLALQPLHVRTRALLRATSNSISDMPGRDKEREIIETFITSFAQATDTDNAATNLYISGSPGSGKTALVHSVLHSIDLSASKVEVVTLNCMGLKDVSVVLDRAYEALQSLKSEKRNAKGSKGKQSIKNLLASLRTKCVLILDELDHVTPDSSSFSALFSLPSSQLRVIGIANTHTLTSGSQLPDSIDVKTLHFAPYTAGDLLAIIHSRLAPLYASETALAMNKFLSPVALTLLSKKVATMTGDVRSVFEVLRGAIDVAQSSASAFHEDFLSAPLLSVTPSHINAALKSHTPVNKPAPSASQPTEPSRGNSEIVSGIRSLGLQARLCLLSILLASQRLEAGLPVSSTSNSPSIKRQTSGSAPTGALEMTQLHAYYCTILSREDSGVLSAVSRSEFGDLLGMLEGIGLVSVSSSLGGSPVKAAKRSFSRSASFGSGSNRGSSSGQVRLASGVWADELLRGLGAGALSKCSGDIAEEEVRAICERERSRLAKDLKAADMKARQSGPRFADAMED